MTTPEPHRAASGPAITLAAASLAFALAIIGSTAVNVALPAIRDELVGGTAGLQWIADAYMLMLASALLTMGALSDALGARRVMLGGIGLCLVGATCAAAAPALDVLIAGQVVLGAGAAALIPSSLALIRHTFHDARVRARAIGVWSSTSAAAVAFGPVVAGLLIGPFGWRAVFVLDLPAALGIGFLAWRWLDETPRRAGAGVDLAGQLTAIVTLAALTFALIEASHTGWTAMPTAGAFGLAIAAGIAFVLTERTAASPMLPLELFRSRAFDVSSAVGMLFNFSVYGQFFVLALYLQEARGLTALQTGLVFLAQPGAYSVVALRTGRLIDLGRPRLLMTLGSALSSAGTLAFLALDDNTPYVVLVAAFMLVGAGAALVIPILTIAVVAAAPPARVGVAVAALNAIRNTGAVLGVAVVGGLVAEARSTERLHTAVLVSAVGLALAALCAGALGFSARTALAETAAAET